jgi:hypothetical protein
MSMATPGGNEAAPPSRIQAICAAEPPNPYRRGIRRAEPGTVQMKLMAQRTAGQWIFITGNPRARFLRRGKKTAPGLKIGFGKTAFGGNPHLDAAPFRFRRGSVNNALSASLRRRFRTSFNLI